MMPLGSKLARPRGGHKFKTWGQRRKTLKFLFSETWRSRALIIWSWTMIFGVYSRCTPLLLGSQVSDINFKFSVTFILLSANAFDLDKSKILSLGNELKCHVDVLNSERSLLFSSINVQNSYDFFSDLSELTFWNEYWTSICPITTQSLVLMPLNDNTKEIIVGKGDITCNEQFLLFSQYLILYMVLTLQFKQTLIDFCNLFHIRPVLNNIVWLHVCV